MIHAVLKWHVIQSQDFYKNFLPSLDDPDKSIMTQTFPSGSKSICKDHQTKVLATEQRKILKKLDWPLCLMLLMQPFLKVKLLQVFYSKHTLWKSTVTLLNTRALKYLSIILPDTCSKLTNQEKQTIYHKEYNNISKTRIFDQNITFPSKRAIVQKIIYVYYYYYYYYVCSLYDNLYYIASIYRKRNTLYKLQKSCNCIVIDNVVYMSIVQKCFSSLLLN